MPREALFREAIMKRQVLLLLAGLTCLTACGGGGGGAGIMGSAMVNTHPNDGILLGSAVKEKVEEDGGNLGRGTRAALQDGIEAGFGYSLHEGSLVIKKGGMEIARFETGDGGDVDLTERGYAVVKAPAPKALVREAIDNFLEDEEGPMEYTSSGIRYNLTRSYPDLGLVLNSDAVPLQYSTFGMWAINYNSKGTWTRISSGESGPVDIWGAWAVPFFDGVDSQKVAPAASTEFTGQAVAIAHIGGGDDGPFLAPVNQWISGDATLTVASSGNSVDLELIFPDYYDITFSDIGLTGGEFAASQKSRVDVVENASHDSSKFSMDIDNIKPYTGTTDYAAGTYLEGQFFGSGQASEAAGKFQVADKNNHNITGAFGVTKP